MKKKTTAFRSSDRKECFICHQIKPLDEFYKHSKIGDGHLNKCKQCTKEQSKERHYHKYLSDPSFVESERARGREKYHRLGYCDRQIESNKDKPWKKNQEYKNLYKRLISRGLISDGENAHHWNYNKINDVFVIDSKDHRFIHTKLRIDESILLFKDRDTGFVLYNYEDHVDLLEGYGIEFRHVIL